jgi:hypothetical protein
MKSQAVMVISHMDGCINCLCWLHFSLHVNSMNKKAVMNFQGHAHRLVCLKRDLIQIEMSDEFDLL